MNYQQAMDYIEARKGLGYSMGLNNIKALCEQLGNPQDKLKYVHVVGTNGKGSVSAFVSTVLTCNGYKVGTYSSPSVFSYEEKMRFQGRPIPKAHLTRLLEQVKEAVDVLEEKGIVPSIFEIETAASFLYFVEKQCDLVVLEAGLGGLEDATNVIQNTLVAVLTSISMDHMDFLGNTLSAITANKAAIIKKGSHAVTMRQADEIIDTVKSKASQMDCPLHIAEISEATGIKYGIQKQSFSYHEYKKIEISLLGKYQIDNAILALEVIDTLQQIGFSMKMDKIKKGMLETQWPGRFTVISKKPYFIIDGAHNADAAKKLSETIDFYFTNKRIVFIMGILKDKEYEEIIKRTYHHAVHIITVSTPNKERTMQAYDLAREVERYHNSVTAADSVEEAVEMSYLLTGKDDVIIAFGSLSYLGRLMDVVNNRDKMGSDSHGRSEQD